MAGTGKEGLELADQVDPDLALVDLRLPDVDGIQVLRDLRTRHPQTAVIMITAFGHIESVVVAMKNGATDYLEKPFQHLEKLRISVSRALEEVKARREINRLQGLEEGKYRTSQIVGEAAPTRRLREVITQLAQSEAHTILVQGESGTGKELVARGLHFESGRRNSPFMEVNCAAITETLFESELFGHEKGAFTDAKSTKKGLIELADGGTLFLDEVGEIPIASQAKLLRCLQERTFKRVGGTRDIKVDVRVIAATNRVPRGDGQGRQVPRGPVLPPQRHPARRSPRSATGARTSCRWGGTSWPRRTTRSTRRSSAWPPRPRCCSLSYGWPGNVRELKNLIERLVILSTGRHDRGRSASAAGLRRRREPDARRGIPRAPHPGGGGEVLHPQGPPAGQRQQERGCEDPRNHTPDSPEEAHRRPLLSPDSFHPLGTTWRTAYGQESASYDTVPEAPRRRKIFVSRGVIDQSRVWYPLCSKAVARDSRGTRPHSRGARNETGRQEAPCRRRRKAADARRREPRWDRAGSRGSGRPSAAWPFHDRRRRHGRRRHPRPHRRRLDRQRGDDPQGRRSLFLVPRVPARAAASLSGLCAVRGTAAAAALRGRPHARRLPAQDQAARLPRSRLRGGPPPGGGRRRRPCTSSRSPVSAGLLRRRWSSAHPRLPYRRPSRPVVPLARTSSP